jgi:4-hydroxy-tetrahydrodipicolinate synthase
MSSFSRAPKLGPLMTAMLTPFDSSGTVDLVEARRLARFLVDEGNHGLVVCGTTGEAPALGSAEQLALVAAVKEEVGDRAGIVAGTGSYNTADTIAFTKEAHAAGADAALVVVPYYSKPTQDGMLAHFGAVAEAVALPLIVYNIPSRTAANMLPETLLELARRHPNVAGVKESTGDCAQFSEILRRRPEGFGFWAGDDNMYLPALALGGDGLISVAAHLCARELRELGDAYAAGDVVRARRIHLALTPLFAALFTTSSPIPVKWAMNELGFALGACRSPLGAMPEASAARLAPLLEGYRERSREAVSLAR